LGAAILGAINPFLIYYSQEARMYALLAAFCAASFLLFSLWLRSSRPPASPWGSLWLAAGYVLATAAGLYTHYAFGFVVIAQNLAALGGVMAHGRPASPAPPSRRSSSAQGKEGARQRRGLAPALSHSKGRLGAWLALQGLTLLLILPWLPTALRQLTTWPVERAAQSFWIAVLDLVRYLVVGRTLPTGDAGWGLVGAAVLLVFALRRRGQTITPLLWLMVPSALTLGFGLLTEAFSKFLLVAVPAVCLLLGSGLAAVPLAGADDLPAWLLPWRQRLRAALWFRLWLAGVAGVAVGTYASLNNLYFNPAYARDNYRGIAQYLAQVRREGDAVLLIAPNQWEAFSYYHRAGAPVFPLPRTRPLDEAATMAELEAIAARHPRLFVLFWGEAQADPGRVVEGWLNTHAFKAGDAWHGQVRLATYAAAAPAAAPQVQVDARFGDQIGLEGYALNPARLAPGDILQVTLFWRTDAPLAERYSVFIHVYADPAAPPVAQQDGEPGGGLRPTVDWSAGERVADNHGVLLPADLPPGVYTVQVGLYNPFTGARLPVTVGGQAAGDRLELETVEIDP
jgi:hypothetical protein